MSEVEEPTQRSIAELAVLLQSGDLSPVTLTEQVLARIERLDPGLKAFNRVTAQQALVGAAEAGRELPQGRCRGPCTVCRWASKTCYRPPERLPRPHRKCWRTGCPRRTRAWCGV